MHVRAFERACLERVHPIEIPKVLYIHVPECTILQKTEFILAYTCTCSKLVNNKYYFILLLMKVRWNSIHAFCTGLQTSNSCDLDDALPSTLVFPVAKQSL